MHQIFLWRLARFDIGSEIRGKVLREETKGIVFMNKIKLAVWGISNAIWTMIKNIIDPEKTEVVLFVDSNEEKQGIYYENTPVITPSKELLDRYDIDVYVIAALSAYENIRELLMTWGRETERVQPFITDEICKYSLGTLDEVDRNFIKEAYFEPRKTESLVNEYKKKYALYLQSQYEGKADWVNQGTLIAHGCGGVVNGRKVMCSNSKEAFEYTVSSNFRLMECDVLRMKDGELVLAHDFWRFYEAKKKGYSVMSLEDLLRRLNEHREIRCLVDVKWDTYDDYRAVIEGTDEIFSHSVKGEKEGESLKSRIVMEAYDEETIKLAHLSGYHIFFTQYRNPEWMDYLNIANLCCQYGIGAVGIRADDVDVRLIKICRKKGIKVFAYSTNCIEEYSKLRKLGVTGVFTDYLRPMVDL